MLLCGECLSAAELAELQSSPTLLDVLNLQKGTLRQYMYFWRLFKQAGHLGQLERRPRLLAGCA